METREGNPARFSAERGTRNARIQHDRARAIPRSVMKIPGCIDMHLQDSDCARRAPGVHFARFQDFPTESRKSEFFTIARTHHRCHRHHPVATIIPRPLVVPVVDAPRARWNPFCRCNIPRQVLEPPILPLSSPSVAYCFSPANSR